MVVGIVVSIFRTFMAVTEAVSAFFVALETGNWDVFLSEIDRIWAQLKTDIGDIGTLFLDTIVSAILDIPNQLVQSVSVSGGSGEALFGQTGWEEIKLFFGSASDWIEERFGNTLLVIKQVATAMWAGLKETWENVIKPIFVGVVAAIAVVITVI